MKSPAPISPTSPFSKLVELAGHLMVGGPLSREAAREMLEQLAAQTLGARVVITGPERVPGSGFLPLRGDREQLLGWMGSEDIELAALPSAALFASLVSALLLLLEAPLWNTHIADLVAARKVLSEMLPASELWAPPYRVSGWLEPAHYVGGDCFDYFVWENKVCFFLADAVGHGLAATLMSLESRALWRALSRSRSPLETAFLLNQTLSEELRGGERFVACCLGNLAVDSGDIRYVCAGLAPSFHAQVSPPAVRVYEWADPPLGVDNQTMFTEQRLKLAPGEQFLLVTDGVLERARADLACFGEDRVSEVLRASIGSGGLLDSLRVALEEFAGGHPHRDDASAVLIERLVPERRGRDRRRALST